MKTIIIFIIIIIFILASFFYGLNESEKQSKKNWEFINILEKRTNLLKTKEEADIFYKEFVEISKKIKGNEYDYVLNKIDRYVRTFHKGLNANNLYSEQDMMNAFTYSGELCWEDYIAHKKINNGVKIKL